MEQGAEGEDSLIGVFDGILKLDVFLVELLIHFCRQAIELGQELFQVAANLGQFARTGVLFNLARAAGRPRSPFGQ